MRQLTAYERSIIERLLEKEFFGRDEVREQVNDSLVERIDENGSLKFFVRTETRAPVKWRIPTEGEVEDEDGVMVHVLLHVVEGKVNELELYKDIASSKVLKPPDPANLELFSPDQW